MSHIVSKPARRRWLVAIITAVAAAIVLGVVLFNAESTRARTGRTLPTPAESAAKDPMTHVDRCNTALDGPSAPPAGAVSVSTEDSLTDVVSAHSDGTTFWLAPGTHHLGTGRFTQVMPHTGDKFIGSPGAVLDGRHENSYAFGGHASDVTIQFLTVQNFGSAGDNNNEGVVNHDSAEGWTVDSSKVQKNAGAGVMIGSRNRVVGNCLRDNGQYGFNAYHRDGVTNVVLEGNEISGNNSDDWESRKPGCGCTGGGKFWATNGATVTGNYVHDNRGVGLWADNNNVGFLFDKNYVSGNAAEGIMYEGSYNAAIVNNTFVRNALVKGPTNPKFPASAIYLSESGSDPRVSGPYDKQFRVSGNLFVDNWSGIVAWENADRFAGSPANTSTGQAPLVNPTVATVDACAQPSKIPNKPYYDDCRWKTQNVAVDGNVFRLDPSQIPLCARSKGCGFNGLFSNYGTYPHWSPYKAKVVQENITFKQNNVWRNNTYFGNWQFIVKEVGNEVGWDAWRSGPYNQDANSKMN